MKKIKISIMILIGMIVVAAVLNSVIFFVKNKPKKTSNKNEIGEKIDAATSENQKEELKKTSDVIIVPTMRDEITSDSTWCPTFQLIWNDLKNEIVKKDIIFNEGQPKIADNLNLGEFDTSMISDSLYYKKYGLKTLQLKEEIEKGIYDKFEQKSDILDKFDWSEEALNGAQEDVTRYFLYVMLYRKFEFINAFDKLQNDKFGKYEDIKYFGINEYSNSKLGNQIEVLYYNSKDDFAIKISTKSDDEVIFCKNPKGNNFKEIYDNMNKKSENYNGDKSFQSIDEFKAPYLTINILKEYDEFYKKTFNIPKPELSTEYVGQIEKALQTVKFKIDEKGGEIKSEAGMDIIMETTAFEPEKIKEPRYFYVDNTFSIFLKESDKDVPYFAGRVENITKFQ